jgi:Dynein heavy chain, N-terminal region 2
VSHVVVVLTRGTITQWSQEEIAVLRKTLPLIAALQSPAMRGRHWASLASSMATLVDPEASSCTMEYLIQLRLEQHANTITDLRDAADKEIVIEKKIEVRLLVDTRCVSTARPFPSPHGSWGAAGS